MKGIILAGGSGTRLYPITFSVSKQLLSIYDKPMIYYPMSVLMIAGIKDILIISTPNDLPNYKKLLGDGSNFGIKIKYKEQHNPDGLAQAFILGKEFIGDENVCLILGDNIFYGNKFSDLLFSSIEKVEKENRSVIFGYKVNDPNRFGIVEFNDKNEAVSIEEKPSKPKSNFAIVGLYFYPNNVIKNVLNIQPSDRGELEISSLNNIYLKKQKLSVEILGRGFTWLDTGTNDTLLDASNVIKSIQKKSGYLVACLEEIALAKGYITKNFLKRNIKNYLNSNYYKYLNNILK